ncbi:hypothetical protein ACOME3_002205 [Neoechinorhynchus agilis]
MSECSYQILHLGVLCGARCFRQIIQSLDQLIISLKDANQPNRSLNVRQQIASTSMTTLRSVRYRCVSSISINPSKSCSVKLTTLARILCSLTTLKNIPQVLIVCVHPFTAVNVSFGLVDLSRCFGIRLKMNFAIYEPVGDEFGLVFNSSSKPLEVIRSFLQRKVNVLCITYAGLDALKQLRNHRSWNCSHIIAFDPPLNFEHYCLLKSIGSPSVKVTFLANKSNEVLAMQNVVLFRGFVRILSDAVHSGIEYDTNGIGNVYRIQNEANVSSLKPISSYLARVNVDRFTENRMICSYFNHGPIKYTLLTFPCIPNLAGIGVIGAGIDYCSSTNNSCCNVVSLLKSIGFITKSGSLFDEKLCADAILNRIIGEEELLEDQEEENTIPIVADCFQKPISCKLLIYVLRIRLKTPLDPGLCPFVEKNCCMALGVLRRRIRC